MSAAKAYGRILAAASELPDCLDPVDVRAVQAAIERARVLGVLDGWAGTDMGLQHVTRHNDRPDRSDPMQWMCELTYLDDQCANYYGSTPDEARAKAAAAIERGEV